MRLPSTSSAVIVSVVVATPSAGKVVGFATTVDVAAETTGTTVSHVAPENPLAHEHVKPFTPSMQTPPLRHGLPTHSSMSISQFVPVKPGGHVQV